jgi:NAD(P)-dependent dehydrogenase (short-subunit alcohol dehydrogenase family)
MKGKVAVVTGGGQGIGRCIARMFVEAGMGVVIAEKDVEAGSTAQEELSPRGEAVFLETDLCDENSVRTMVASCLERFGRIDVLVNNAGIMYEKPLEELSLQEWNRVLATNLTGAFLCARECAPSLRANRGSIVNIASTRAHMSEPHTESYAASKGGLVALTHALAVSLGPEVRVNAVSPGWIEVRDWKKPSLREEPILTPEDHLQHPAGRVGRPEDVAALVLFLASSRSGFVTGQEFLVDGGMTRKMIYR